MKAGIVACSNPQKAEWKEQNDEVIRFLRENGHELEISSCIYETDSSIMDRGERCTAELNRMFADPQMEEIYDISGGDMANELLDDLDFEAIAGSQATFWGYSDLTTVINAIYAKTGKSSVLYQIKNTVSEQHGHMQRRRFKNREELFDVRWNMVQGTEMEGIVIGGNIRCFLKLAGTGYMPDFWGRILFLESLGGTVPQMITYLSQLRSLGVFEQVAGVMLGTFSEMEREKCSPDIITLVKMFAGEDLPIAKTSEVGHGRDAKALRIGEWISVR